jgi:hypothetical protein
MRTTTFTLTFYRGVLKQMLMDVSRLRGLLTRMAQ